MYVRLLDDFALVIKFIINAIEFGGLTDDGARIRRLVQIATDKSFCARLHLELAVVVAVAKPLVEATYLLEGNGPLALIAYDQVMRVKKHFEIHKENATWPGVPEAITQYTVEMAEVVGDDMNENEFRVTTVEEVIGIVEPVEEYFTSRIFGLLGKDIDVYRALRNANPLAIRRSPPTPGEFRIAVESMDHFTSSDITKMVEELPKYLDLSDNWGVPERSVDELKSLIKFWQLHMNELPYIRKFVKYAYTIITSSAAAERVFSVIKRSFDTGQKGALEDYVFLSSIMQYNKVNGVQELRII